MSTTSACESKIPTEVFADSIEFALEVGDARAKMRAFDREAVALDLNALMRDVLAKAEQQIETWHNYLSVDQLHSDGCLRAAFSTVTALCKGFGTIRDIGHSIHRREPDFFTTDMLDDYSQIVESFEDIQESLAVLIDDEARDELRSVLRDAGIESKMLDRKDEEASEAPRPDHR